MRCLGLLLGGWYLGYWNGNFSLLLFILTLVTLGYWLVERFHFKAAAARRRDPASSRVRARRVELERRGSNRSTATDAAPPRRARQPWWLDWTAGLFPVILVVFLLRSFLFEPFKIPSGLDDPDAARRRPDPRQQVPLRRALPVINTDHANHDPQRGDVMVFRFPRDPSVDYIKRVVGVPGDEVVYSEQAADHQRTAGPGRAPARLLRRGSMRYVPQFTELLGAVSHRILVNPRAQPIYSGDRPFPYRENCSYSVEGLRCKVPQGYYFMMGDNRDNPGLSLLGLRARREHRRQGVLRVDEPRQPEAHRSFH